MNPSREHLLAAFAGAVFGLGLAISQMVNPQKVLNFLDVSGNWDPSLLLVFASGLLVTLVAFRFVLRAERPLLQPQFHLPTRRDIDARLLVGSALFGVGWGIGGYCPGPALAALTTLSIEPLLFVGCMLLGGQLPGLLDRPRPTRPIAPGA